MTAMYKATKDKPSRGLQYKAAYDEAEDRFYSKYPACRKDNAMLKKAMANNGDLIEEVGDTVKTIKYGKD
jgi:hypothetical protein